MLAHKGFSHQKSFGNVDNVEKPSRNIDRRESTQCEIIPEQLALTISLQLNFFFGTDWSVIILQQSLHKCINTKKQSIPASPFLGPVGRSPPSFKSPIISEWNYDEIEVTNIAATLIK